MRDLLIKIGLRMGWVTSPIILFDLATHGENSPFYKRYYKKYKKKDEKYRRILEQRKDLQGLIFMQGKEKKWKRNF